MRIFTAYWRSPKLVGSSIDLLRPDLHYSPVYDGPEVTTFCIRLEIKNEGANNFLALWKVGGGSKLFDFMANLAGLWCCLHLNIILNGVVDAQSLARAPLVCNKEHSVRFFSTGLCSFLNRDF